MRSEQELSISPAPAMKGGWGGVQRRPLLGSRRPRHHQFYPWRPTSSPARFSASFPSPVANGARFIHLCESSARVRLNDSSFVAPLRSYLQLQSPCSQHGQDLAKNLEVLLSGKHANACALAEEAWRKISAPTARRLSKLEASSPR